MLLKTYLTTNDEIGGLDDAAAALAYNTDPVNYVPVYSESILAWMGDAGRMISLEGFANQPIQEGETALVTGMKSALKAMLLGLNNNRSYLDLTMGGKQHMLMQGLAQLALPGLAASDMDELMQRAFAKDFSPTNDVEVRRLRDEIALEEADAVAQQARQIHANTVNAHNEQVLQMYRSLSRQSIFDPNLSPLQLDAPNAPADYHWNGTDLVKNDPAT
ncbi:MAG: hypothetical protein AAGD32_13695 [Planctomycetota bacterium]